MRLKLRVIPRASRTGWGDMRGEARVVRLTAAPVDGKANERLRRFLADEFGTSLSAVAIERGLRSREKVVEIADPTRIPEALQ